MNPFINLMKKGNTIEDLIQTNISSLFLARMKYKVIIRSPEMAL